MMVAPKELNWVDRMVVPMVAMKVAKMAVMMVVPMAVR